MTKKNKSTKYELTRKDISEKLQEIVETLEANSVYDVSPNELNSTIEGVVADLEGLQSDITMEA